ncbi:MAG: ATP-binding protein [Atopobiaceae bacterium]|nr:ATP-binding protein [Atopobiaceae bacterium]
MNDTTRCPHCGRELPRLTQTLLGREYDVGAGECGCDAARAERAEAERAERERERAEMRAAEMRRRRDAGIPERYVLAESDKAQAIASLWDEGTGFYIDGDQGTGKSHVAAATAIRLINLGRSARFVVVPDLMEAMRTRKAEDRDLTDQLCTVDVLVLDDLGKETPTAYACERLFHIVNARYNAKLPIGVTSNFTRGEIAQRLTEGDVGRSIASRLCEMTRRIHLDGEDRRLRHG